MTYSIVKDPDTTELEYIAQWMAEEDQRECLDLGSEPRQALFTSYGSPGLFKIAVDPDDQPLGAFGIHLHNDASDVVGRIWSLWIEHLTLSDANFIIHETRRQVPSMLRELGLESANNWISKRNTRALQWIEGSKCFTLGGDYDINNRPYREFTTRPLKELDLLNV